MRKTLTTILTLGLISGALLAPQAEAAKRKPVATTLFLHSTETVDEVNAFAGENFMVMDKSAPTATEPSSMFVTNYVAGPNTACSGNQLVPTWTGNLAGTVKGNLTFKLHTVATPAARIQIELFPDGNGGCDGGALGNSGYVPPVATQIVDVPPGPGTVEAKFSGLNFKSRGNLTVMVTIAPGVTGLGPPDPVQVRLLYDSADFASAVKFSCTPARGKTCTF